MVHPYIINTINALVLIGAGLTGYFASPERPLTALAAVAFGLLLLACTHHLRRHNRFVFNTVTALTLLLGFIVVARIGPATFAWDLRHVLHLLVGASCFIAVAFYIGSFVRERRLRNNEIYKDDL